MFHILEELQRDYGKDRASGEEVDLRLRKLFVGLEIKKDKERSDAKEIKTKETYQNTFQCTAYKIYESQEIQRPTEDPRDEVRDMTFIYRLLGTYRQ